MKKRSKQGIKKLMPLMPFMEMLKRKLVTWDDINDFIVEWHEGNYECSLHEFLGMSEQQYALWVQSPQLENHIFYLA